MDRVVLVDVSTNGTWVNNNIIRTECELRSGDVVTVLHEDKVPQ